jgi:hypothetical protein
LPVPAQKSAPQTATNRQSAPVAVQPPAAATPVISGATSSTTITTSSNGKQTVGQKMQTEIMYINTKLAKLFNLIAIMQTSLDKKQDKERKSLCINDGGIITVLLSNQSFMFKHSSSIVLHLSIDCIEQCFSLCVCLSVANHLFN